MTQFSPNTTTNTIGIEDAASTSQQTNYSNELQFIDLPATTIAFGGTAYTGTITIGENGVVDIGSKNAIFITVDGEVTGLENILSGGIVATLSTLPSVFIPPILDNISVDLDDDELLLFEEDDDDENGNALLIENEADDSGMCTAL